MLLLLLNLFDLLFTFLLLGMGATELNPVARGIFDSGVVPALLYKLMPGAAGFGLWWFSDRSTWAARWLRWLVFLYGVIVIYQILNLGLSAIT